MSKTEDAEVQSVVIDESVPAPDTQLSKPTRREFLGQSLAATSAIALAGMLPTEFLRAAAQSCVPAGGKKLIEIKQIKSSGKKLQAVLKLRGERGLERIVSGPTDKRLLLRFFEGYNAANPADASQQWPSNKDLVGNDVPANAPVPGPTFRANVGDTIQITFLNQVKVGHFSNSLDKGERGETPGCDETPLDPKPPNFPPDKKWYPYEDTFPNCFHGSSTTNIHYHGTHVTPSTTGDNVLIFIRPSEKVVENDVEALFRELFQHCDTHGEPKKWEDLPEGFRNLQMGPYRDSAGKSYPKGLIGDYDDNAPYQDGRGLPEGKRLWPINKAAIDQGLWPQYFIGAYPYCYKLPEYKEDAQGNPTGVRMGQAPGTHWYHAHKHGSTAINVFNGLVGAFIIADDTAEGYDGKLRSFYRNKFGHELKETVLVVQQITDTINLMSIRLVGGNPRSPGAIPFFVNGQSMPWVEMRPGEVQLWRMVNAAPQGFTEIGFSSPDFTYRQTAQDGVQFKFANFQKSVNPKITIAPSNRVDLLVKAPTTPGNYEMEGLVNICVKSGTPLTLGFPETEAEFPKFPDFLKDIRADKVRIWRKIEYGWEEGRTRNRRNPANAPRPYAPPQFTIDDRQFEDGVVDQLMLLNDTEEWTIYNKTTLAHPFHIHVNPFQLVEVFAPADSATPVKFEKDMIWHDAFAIPAGKLDGDKIIPGHFKMRTRFVDFTGMYVQHCHILAHEDRGMMQLLEVRDKVRTPFKHH